MAARNPKPVMHSKHERNYLLATHGAAVAVACIHYGNNVGCDYCSYDCHYGGCNCNYNIDQATATTTTAMTATTATASTPTLRSNTSNTIMAYVCAAMAQDLQFPQHNYSLDVGQVLIFSFSSAQMRILWWWR